MHFHDTSFSVPYPADNVQKSIAKNEVKKPTRCAQSLSGRCLENQHPIRAQNSVKFFNQGDLDVSR